MKRFAKRISRLQLAINAIRKELQENEKKNVNLRKALSILWDDKEKRAELDVMLKELVGGRGVTKALQDRLHALKGEMKRANRMLDNVSHS